MKHDNVIELELDKIRYDEKYKYSPDMLSDELIRSVAENGVLNPLAVYVADGNYRIISGHNRYRAAEKAGCLSVKCEICMLDKFDFISELLSRNYHGTVSPVKKIRFINDFNVTGKEVFRKLNIPELYSSHEMRSDVLDLPENILRYLDIKNVNFKVIEKICSFDGKNLDLISRLMISDNLRINIFRDMISMIYDFSRSGLFFEFEEVENESLKKYEDRVIERMKALRYPKYSAALINADKILEKYRNNGIAISIPKFFEGNSVHIAFELRKPEDMDKKINQLKKIEKNDLDELLKLL